MAGTLPAGTLRTLQLGGHDAFWVGWFVNLPDFPKHCHEEEQIWAILCEGQLIQIPWLRCVFIVCFSVNVMVWVCVWFVAFAWMNPWGPWGTSYPISIGQEIKCLGRDDIIGDGSIRAFTDHLALVLEWLQRLKGYKLTYTDTKAVHVKMYFFKWLL